jgi:hypothetical protein
MIKITEGSCWCLVLPGSANNFKRVTTALKYISYNGDQLAATVQQRITKRIK